MDTLEQTTNKKKTKASQIWQYLVSWVEVKEINLSFKVINQQTWNEIYENINSTSYEISFLSFFFVFYPFHECAMKFNLDRKKK
jgi:hypothetical protein